VLAKIVLTAVKGFCMGAADIVPGVSGGTVALVFGIYERLVDNVRRGARALAALIRLDAVGFVRRLRELEWPFLLPLAAGLLIALAVLSSVIERLLRDNPEEMAGLFLGLVLGSIVVAWGLLHRATAAALAMMATVGLIAFLLLGLQSGPVADPSLPAYFGAGAIAICAMILPGISGSFLLLMMGMYAAVLGAVHDRDLLVLLVFTAGATLGLALFSTALGHLLERHHDLLMGALIGLMLGSVRVLWPWPNGVGIISDVAGESVSGTGLELPAGDQWLAPTALAVVAFVAVVAIAHLAPSSHKSPDLPRQVHA
jgi:putative membrane protein